MFWVPREIVHSSQTLAGDAAKVPHKCRTRSAQVPHKFRTSSAQDPYKFRTSSAQVRTSPHKFRTSWQLVRGSPGCNIFKKSGFVILSGFSQGSWRVLRWKCQNVPHKLGNLPHKLGNLPHKLSRLPHKSAQVPHKLWRPKLLRTRPDFLRGNLLILVARRRFLGDPGGGIFKPIE